VQRSAAGLRAPTGSKEGSSYEKSIVTITSKTVAGEWWGQQVLDIADLHGKDLEFEVLIYHLKLREMPRAV